MTPSPAARAEALSDRLRRTTEEMANVCRVNMRLWGEHSNACLEAAAILDAAPEIIESALALIRLHVQPDSDDEYTATAGALHTLLTTLPAKGNALSPRSVDERESQQ